jgi:ribonuclease HII
VAAACIIPPGVYIEGVDDSKQLSAPVRKRVFERIKQTEGIIYAVAMMDAAVVDEINILQATIQAMLSAVNQLSICPDFLLVDGLKLNHPAIESQKIIRGDSLSQSIAAASIIAKESRDSLMLQYDEQWPQYGFKDHKGYGTSKHRQALVQYGACPIHRRTFEPVKSLVQEALC